MSQALTLFPEMHKRVTGVIAPINADEVMLRFSIVEGELDSLPSPTPKTHTQSYGGVGPGCPSHACSGC